MIFCLFLQHQICNQCILSVTNSIYRTFVLRSLRTHNGEIKQIRVKTKFIQKSFDANSTRVANNIAGKVHDAVNRIINKSRKLSKKR